MGAGDLCSGQRRSVHLEKTTVLQARMNGTARKIQSKPGRKQVQNVEAIRSQPLAGKSFYLDLPSGKTLEFLEKSVKRFGGVVESFLSKEVTCIVSNNQEARKENVGRKQTATALRNTQAGSHTSVGLGKGHRNPSHKPADAVIITRGRALLQKAIGTQSNTCGGNSVLASARSWGIQIMHTDDMFSYLQWLDSKRCRSTRQMKPFPSETQSAPQVTKLQSPFLKVEDESRRLRPFMQQFKNFPELCFLEQRRHSPFDPPRSPASSKTPEGPPARHKSSSDFRLVPKRQRGYCECCEETFVELQTHLHSLRHRAFVSDASHYASVDSLISQMTNIFAVSSSSPLSPRVPSSASGDHSVFEEDVLQRIVGSSGQHQKPCLSAESSDGRPVNRESPALLPEDQSLWQSTELLREMLDTPALLTSQTVWSLSDRAGGGSNGAEHRGRGGTDADVPLKPTPSPEAGSGAASQQKIGTTPALLPSQPRKHKLSSSPRGQVKKRPMLTALPLSQLLPDTNALPGIPPASPTEGSFSQEGGGHTSLGCLQLSSFPVAKPHCSLHAPTQFSPEGSDWPPQERAAADPGCLKQPVQRLEQKEGSAAVRTSEDWHTQTPGKPPCVDAKLGTRHFPTGACMSLPGSVTRPCSPGGGLSQVVETVVPECSGLGLPPLSGPSSSESEWDRPLLCALEGTSRFPLKRPIDSALLGTSVSVRDSGYESHLSSVLWQSLEPPRKFCGQPSIPSGPA